MQYIKPALTVEQQVGLLIQRGMQGDPQFMAKCLSSVGYYRLSGYWYHLRQTDDRFKHNARFDEAWNQYLFDRSLKVEIIQAIEQVEVAIRTQFSESSAIAGGAFGYVETLSSQEGHNYDERCGTLCKIRDEVKRSREIFVRHFKEKYSDNYPNLPIWMVSEILSFGTLVYLYKYSSPKVRAAVSSRYGVYDRVFESWLWCMNEVRNICAHHGRLWNRSLGNRPMIPAKDTRWFTPHPFESNRVYAVLLLCAHLLKEAMPDAQWPKRVFQLIHDCTPQQLRSMGFPPNWERCPLWSL